MALGMRREHRARDLQVCRNRRYTDPYLVTKTQGHSHMQRNTLRMRQQHRFIYLEIQ